MLGCPGPRAEVSTSWVSPASFFRNQNQFVVCGCRGATAAAVTGGDQTGNALPPTHKDEARGGGQASPGRPCGHRLGPGRTRGSAPGTWASARSRRAQHLRGHNGLLACPPGPNGLAPAWRARGGPHKASAYLVVYGRPKHTERQAQGPDGWCHVPCHRRTAYRGHDRLPPKLLFRKMTVFAAPWVTAQRCFHPA